MALLKWNEDEENKEDEFESPVVKTIKSVQSGWQPTEDEAEAVSEDGEVQPAEAENQNYLLSEQKAEFDGQVQQQRANEEAARASAAAADEANRRAAAAQQLQVQQSLPQNVTPAGSPAPQAIPGFNVMSPKAQQAALKKRMAEDNQRKAEETTKFWGNVPLIGTAMNWGAGLASVVGKHTGNTELQQRADNQRKLLTLGMNTNEFNAYDEKTRNRLETLQTGVTGLGALDVFGVASLAKMPLIAGIKGAAKEGFTSQAGRQILKESAQQTGQQYGKNVAIGAGVSGIADPAIQAYIKDGQVDWSSVPSSMLQGGIWAAAIPEFSGKARLTQKLQSGQTLTPEDSLEINNALNTTPAPAVPAEPPRVADGVVTPIRDGNLSFDNRDDETPIEIPALQSINPIADNFTPATEPTPAPVAGNLTPVQQSPTIDMPEQVTPEAPMSLEQLSEHATLDNVTPATDVPATPAAPAPVADGTVLPAKNIPAVKSEEVRALREARAGTSQAEEAEINQRLQQAENQTPNYFQEDSEISDINRILKNEETVAGGKKVADYYREAKGEDWHVQDMTPDEYLDRAAKAMGSNDPQHWRGAHTGNVEAYAEAMRNGDKFPMPFINEVRGSQEGRTRALAAKMAGQEKMRVAVAEKYNPERYAERIKTEEDLARSQRMLDILEGRATSDMPDWMMPAQKEAPKPRTADDDLDDLDARLERGEIDYDEHARLEDEIFTRENQAGRAMAEDADPVPTHSAYGRKIEMTEANGYKAVDTADGGKVYQKVAKTGSNTKGTQLNNTWYDKQGNKLTQAQAEAMISGQLKSAAPKLDKVTPVSEPNSIPDSMDDMPTKPVTPVTKDSVPDGMGVTETPAADKKVKKAETYLQKTVSSDASAMDAKRAIRGVSDVDDLENLDELIDNIPKATPKIKQRLRDEYAAIEAAQKRINQIQNQFRKDAGKDGGGNMATDKAKELAHERNKLVQDMQIAEKNMQSTIRRIESRQSIKQRALNSMANLTSYSQGNMLASLPVQEKNIVGDIISSVTTAVQHPIKMATNIPEARLASEMKRVVREAAQVTPQTLSEVPKYLIRTALSPVYAINNSLANVRGGMYRNELAKTELIKSGIKNPTAEQIKLQAMRAGNAREIIVNLNKGVGSAMSDPYKAAKAADDYFKVLESAKSHKELAKFAEETRQSTEILQGMMSGKATDGKVTPMSLLINNLYPFLNPAINSVKKAIYQLDPRKASQMNEIRKTIQSPTRQNIAKLTKIAGTATALVAIVSLLEDETIAYNDGDSDVSRPRGWSVKTGENTYMPVRAFGVFEPFIVATGVTYEVMSGNVKSPKDALKMAASSLPYLSSSEFYMQSVDEMADGNMWGYGTQSQAVARTKNLVPFVNNGLDRWTDRNNGESTDSMSAYVSKKNEEGKSVPDFLPWLDNAVGAGFGMENGITGTQKGMKGSYTPAGQRRTADNQGAFVNKTINDENTKIHNSTIADLVDYGRENELGADAKEMFNTYDTGKNNNFKLVQDTITFLDGEPDNAKKLENNAKIGVLAAQIRDGFYGDTGNDLLTLDGKELYSDASVPNKSGTKNSRLPLSMQSIKNAVAATDLPEAQRDRMYEISQANQELYARRKNKEITYDQEQAMKAANEQEYVQILSSSPSYKKMVGLMDKLKDTGFFNEGGLGSTKSGQTYLWNSLNALLGSKGATPAANYPEGAGKGWTPWGRRGGGGSGGSKNTLKNGKTGTDGVKWTPAGQRRMASVSGGKYTPVQIKVKLGNEVKKNRTQNYSDRSF